MKKIIFVLFIMYTSFISSYSQSGWFPQNSGTGTWLHSVGFFNSNTGIITGYSSSVILRTTNGGQIWNQTVLNQDEMGFFGLAIVNENTGWIAGNKEPNSPYLNAVYRTTNSGVNWILQYQSNGRMADIFFLNAQTGWIAGQDLLKTTNSGINWLIIPSADYRPSLSLFFLNENTGWVGGNPQSPVSIMKTTNGGSSWIWQLNGGHCYSLYFTSDLTGFSALPNGIKKTTNGGTNWLTSYSADHGISLVFVNTQSGWALAQFSNPTWRRLIKTTDAGYSWTDQGYTDPKILNNIFMLNSNTGWVVGDEGVIYKTTNGGALGIQPVSSEIPEEYSLGQNYPNPFNPITKIRFDIPPSPLERAGVRLIIYDILGREVTALVNEQLQPGTYETQWNAGNYPSGNYFYKLDAGTFTETRKMVLIK